MIKNLIPIKKFKEGLKVKGFFLCTEKHLRFTKSSDLFIDLELRDITGHISAKIWENVDKLDGKFESGNAVVVSGNVESFLGRLQLIIKKINKATVQYYGRYGFDPGLIVPKSKINPEKMWNRLEVFINDIDNRYCKSLLKLIFRKFKKQILFHPASIKEHYNYRSGFLEYLVNISKSAQKMSLLYSMDQDLVLTGVLLNDIGVIKEINSDYQFDYTKEGRLIGRKVLSRDIVKDFSSRIKNFPEEILIKLYHIILFDPINSKNNTKYASFPEAILVEIIILLDIKINIMKNLIDEDQEPGEFTNKFNYFGFPIMKKK